MRLTVDVLIRARQFMNTCGERELDLRNRGVVQIENLGVLQNQFDVLDFTNNDIERVENFPKAKRLKWLIFNDNVITTIQKGLDKTIPNLEVLILTGNRIGLLSEIDKLQFCSKLKVLNLKDNPVCSRDNYRLYVIHKLRSLTFLDDDKIRKTEREMAAQMFSSSAGAVFLDRINEQAKIANASTSSAAVAGLVMTTEERNNLRAALLNAKTQAEMDRIEQLLQSGVVPDGGTMITKPDAAAILSSSVNIATNPSKEEITKAAPAPLDSPPSAPRPMAASAVQDNSGDNVTAIKPSQEAQKVEPQSEPPQKALPANVTEQARKEPAQEDALKDCKTRTECAPMPTKRSRNSSAAGTSPESNEKNARTSKRTKPSSPEPPEEKKQEPVPPPKRTKRGTTRSSKVKVDVDEKEGDTDCKPKESPRNRRSKRKTADEKAESREREQEPVDKVANDPGSDENPVETGWIYSLKVTQLAAELKKRKCNPKGRKADLQKRLLETIIAQGK